MEGVVEGVLEWRDGEDTEGPCEMGEVLRDTQEGVKVAGECELG